MLHILSENETVVK